MNGDVRLQVIDWTTPRMGKAMPGLPVEETTMVRVLRLCLASVGDFFDGEFRRIGLSEHAFHVLCLLFATEDGRASPSDLSELVGTSRANMTRILTSLVDDGLATRRTEEMDARRQTIEITAAGRNAALQAVPQLAPSLKAAFSGLSDEEFKLLDELLRKCIRSFDANASRLSSAVK